MKMYEVIIIAKKWDIPYKIGMTKGDLIRGIQKREGYTACFRRQDFCEEKECLWMDDCIQSCSIMNPRRRGGYEQETWKEQCSGVQGEGGVDL